MAGQTELGKAFEYACVNELKKRSEEIQDVILEESLQLNTARQYFEELDDNKKEDFLLAAKAAIRIVEKLEPILTHGDENIPLFLSLQTDAQGMSGDVRDVVCRRNQNEWEIGISCKHNHHAVKHSRLSDTIDFGKEWFSKKCSSTYFDEILPVFSKLRKMRDESRMQGSPILWNDIQNKFDDYYVPVLTAFVKELKRLDSEYPKEIPELLIRYLVGRYDFYKVITDDKRRTTTVQVVNLSGTLNKCSKGYYPIAKVTTLKMPTRFYHIGFKEGSQNTIEVVCDEGWTVSMRLHNASSKVEPSLKFDVNLISLPSSIHSQVEPWDATNQIREKNRVSTYTDKILKTK